METWKPIPGAPLYEASDRGRIRSWKHRNGAKGRAKKPRALKQTGAPYLKVSIYAGVKRKIETHILIARAFLGEQPEGCVVCHNNGNPTDNRPGNLRFDTQSNNLKDCFTHGTERFRGERNARAKLKEGDVRVIRKKLSAGASKASIGRDHGVSATTIFLIDSGQCWGHVK